MEPPVTCCGAEFPSSLNEAGRSFQLCPSVLGNEQTQGKEGFETRQNMLGHSAAGSGVSWETSPEAGLAPKSKSLCPTFHFTGGPQGATCLLAGPGDATDRATLAFADLGRVVSPLGQDECSVP